MNQLMFAYALTMNIAGVIAIFSIPIHPLTYAIVTTFPLLVVLGDLGGFYD